MNYSIGFIGTAIMAIVSLAPVAALAGTVVITTPSGHSTIVETNGVASHVTSDYSAQINDVFADTGEHVVVSPGGTNTSDSSGSIATVTVVNN